jgi:hypothetical protein
MILILEADMWFMGYCFISFYTKTGSPTVFVELLNVGTNSIRPLPQMTPWTNAIRPYHKNCHRTKKLNHISLKNSWLSFEDFSFEK